MVLEGLFKLMAQQHASDVFITAGTPIHIKINGQSVPVNQQMITPDMAESMARDIMTPDQWEDFVEKRESNLSIGLPGVGNFRVNVFRQRSACALVIRYIASNIPELASLGVPKILGEIIMETRGLVLMVGATGSGKSTTIASMVDHRAANRNGHILTIEDPIEFLFRHKKSIINQREVGVDTEDWHVALKNAMRQAPDCILIGEIRDKNTMSAALSYAQSGHLVLATLHANNSYHAMNRIINFFPLENRQSLFLDLAISLRAILSQRLISKIGGGRIPTNEILLNTRNIADLIEKGETSSIKEAMEKSLAPGCQTFEQDLFRLVKQGRITLDEAMKNSDSPTNLNWLINNSTAKIEMPKLDEHGKEQEDPNKGVSDFGNFQLQSGD